MRGSSPPDRTRADRPRSPFQGRVGCRFTDSHNEPWCQVARDESTNSQATRRVGGVPTERSARSLLLTVLGELAVPAGQPVWTASLIHVLGGLGVVEQTARQTLARAAGRGWITGERIGRAVRRSVMPVATDMIEDITRRVVSLNTSRSIGTVTGSFSMWLFLRRRRRSVGGCTAHRGGPDSAIPRRARGPARTLIGSTRPEGSSRTWI